MYSIYCPFSILGETLYNPIGQVPVFEWDFFLPKQSRHVIPKVPSNAYESQRKTPGYSDWLWKITHLHNPPTCNNSKFTEQGESDR